MSVFDESHLERDDYTLTVSDEEAGERFDVFLAAKFPQHSRVRLRQIINDTSAKVNDLRRKAAYRLRTGDIVSIEFPPREPEGAEPENIPLDILHEDDWIVAINKPHGMVVHPSKGHWQGTLTAALAYHFDALSQLAGPARPGIVHRLDRDTSGVIVIAKNDQAHLRLARQFENRTVEKQYFAIGHGTIDRDRDLTHAPIGMHPYQRNKMAVRSGHSTSREATTYVEVAERLHKFTTFRVFPKSGRTHQIRVHLMHLGCPIVCDPLYTGRRQITLGEIQRGSPDEQIVLDRLGLHSHRLAVDHPETGKRVEFVAAIPQALADFVKVVGEQKRQ